MSVEPFSCLPVNVERSLAELLRQIWEGDMDSEVLEACRQHMTELLGVEAELCAKAKVVASSTLSTSTRVATQSATQAAACVAARAVALTFTEKFVFDAHSITDADCADMNRYFTASALANFTFALATFEAIMRSSKAMSELHVK